MKVDVNKFTTHRNFTSKERQSDVNPYDLRKRWQIGLGDASKTLNTTTQRMLQSAIMPISRQCGADHIFERPCINGTIFTETMLGWYNSLDGNCYTQVFANDSYFADAYPKEKKNISGRN